LGSCFDGGGAEEGYHYEGISLHRPQDLTPTPTDFVKTLSMRIAKVAGLDDDKRGSFVVVVEKIDRTWLCSCNFAHWISTNNTLVLC
jgi:hypothetical protein